MVLIKICVCDIVCAPYAKPLIIRRILIRGYQGDTAHAQHSARGGLRAYAYGTHARWRLRPHAPGTNAVAPFNYPPSRGRTALN